MSQLTPNPLKVATSVFRAMRRRAPAPSGPATLTHDGLLPVLSSLMSGGVPALVDVAPEMLVYRNELEALDPDELTRDHALAYWLNLYNLSALELAKTTLLAAAESVLVVEDGFDRKTSTVAGEQLSMHDIEHGKIRRFKDPRIHAALVCGSASCPTLRAEPYNGDKLNSQLDDQLRVFLDAGGAVKHDGKLSLSRVFLWYGSDFTRSAKMPTWLPARRSAVGRAVRPWLPPHLRDWAHEHNPNITFQRFDWALGCAVR